MTVIQKFFRPDDKADIQVLAEELQARVDELVAELAPLSGHRLKIETGRNPFCGVWSVEGDADTAELVAQRMVEFKRKVKPTEADALLTSRRERGVLKRA
jgi:hypothetical protein